MSNSRRHMGNRGCLGVISPSLMAGGAWNSSWQCLVLLYGETSTTVRHYVRVLTVGLGRVLPLLSVGGKLRSKAISTILAPSATTRGSNWVTVGSPKSHRLMFGHRCCPTSRRMNETPPSYMQRTRRFSHASKDRIIFHDTLISSSQRLLSSLTIEI